MNMAQEFAQQVQGQTLDAVRKTQDAIVEAVTAWTKTAGKGAGFAKLTEQFPTATAVIDANFDFAQQILTSQLDFAGRVVAATAPNTVTPKATAPKAIAARSAPAAAKKTKPKTTPATKSAAPKATTAAKKSSADRSSRTVE